MLSLALHAYYAKVLWLCQVPPPLRSLSAIDDTCNLFYVAGFGV